MNSKREFTLILIIFGIIIYFPIFLHLDYGGLYRWDESNNAIHAFEMSQNGNYLRRFFLGEPETWETKPPLLTWLQVLSIKVFGYNELAIRFPSGLAVFFTVILILKFFISYLKDMWGGIFSCLVLLTSSGYIRGHVSRTGDHDALLILFLVGGVLYYFKYLNSKDEARKTNILIFFTFLLFGVLSKSIAGFLFAPALLLYTIWQKKFISTITDKYFWIGMLCFILFIGSYYGLNEYKYPGYLELVWGNELFPRYFNVAKGHNYNQMPERFYFTKVLFSKHFKWFILFVPLAIFLLLKTSQKRAKGFFYLIGITALLFHLISSNGTYNSWYNAPIFPLLSIIVGAGIAILFKAVVDQFKLRNISYYLFATIFTFSIFFYPYKDIILNQCYFKEHWASDDIYGEYMKKLEKEKPELIDYFVFHEIRNRHFLFYKYVYTDIKGYNIRNCGLGSILDCIDEKKPKLNDTVMICTDQIFKPVNKMYNLVQIDSYKNCKLFTFKGERKKID